MNSRTPRAGRPVDLNSVFRELHDELKNLVLTCDPEFPKEATGGLEFLADLLDLQIIVAAYNRELLVRLCQSAYHDVAGASSVLGRAPEFLRLWQERGKLVTQENRSEGEIDAVIRGQVGLLLGEMRPLSEEKLRTLSRNESIPEMLYYLSTLEESLSWYATRYLARLSGEFIQKET